MGTWILETLLWAIVTVAVCVAIWGLNMTNILIALGASVAVSLLLGNSWRSYLNHLYYLDCFSKLGTDKSKP